VRKVEPLEGISPKDAWYGRLTVSRKLEVWYLSLTREGIRVEPWTLCPVPRDLLLAIAIHHCAANFTGTAYA